MGVVKNTDIPIGRAPGADLRVRRILSQIITQLQITPNPQTGTAYTPSLNDANQTVTLNNASAITFTIPLNASVALPIGTKIYLIQLGAGQVTVAAAGGVTLHSYTSLVKLAGQYADGKLEKIATDTWILSGRLA